MKRSNLKFLVLSILCVSLLATSCKKDPVPVNEAQVLVDYLESADSPLMKDYVSTDMPAMILASDVHTLNQTGQVYIIDIRGATDFAAGHIANAVNVSTLDMLTHVDGVDLTTYEKVAIVCYSGQTACWTTCLLRIMGHGNVYAMKWGMCSWHADFAGSWQGNITNSHVSEFVSEETAKGAAGDMPTLTTGFETGQEILEARVAAVFTEGFGAAKVSKTEVFGALDSYCIANYWSAEHYAAPGHIPGAMQYTPKLSMQVGEDLKTLSTTKPVVIYCYTGQTSANLTAYLRVLGYDAKSLLYGVNGMAYDEMVAGSMPHFGDEYIMNYDYVQ
ncbi:MAG: hypothetical protein HN352_04120 [Bacteroidetes bacterium]|jgi:rhodanese-related sulfurtransferase|nr:hypothetical protein [Bacteroidota bacterium]MBT3748535.1 hypothetical protein [Bacteroidota bacterium]MBT4411244.1 hypothetical protein [Bacteroidota bacterium]MBT7094893.1 hypothetical protein [Bacteroidota bacterium]MBT7465337.1 hypothetical protein [Bacteroidota bacterium]